MTPSSLIRNLEMNLSRSAKIFLIAFPLAMLFVLICLWIHPTATGDELACVVTVPLIVCYLLVRGVSWLAASDTHELAAKEAAEKSHHPSVDESALLTIAAIGFVLGLWTITLSLLSFPAYLLLNLGWAARGCLVLIKLSAYLAGSCAGLVTLRLLCREWVLKIARFARSAVNDPVAGWLHAPFDDSHGPWAAHR
ncbi:MAG: hypothetical protein ACJ74Z_00090 [Bryobacteraceae bacterium]|jgi:hypothetical protein